VVRYELVNGASYEVLDVILDKAYPGYRINADTILYFGPPAGVLLAAESTRDFHFVGMPPGAILLTPISTRIECQRKRSWQQTDVTRREMPCVAAFACTDYKVQSRTLDPVALELRGDADHEYRRPGGSQSMRPVRLVRAAVARPVPSSYHAHFQGTRKGLCAQQGARKHGRCRGEVGVTERGDNQGGGIAGLDRRMMGQKDFPCRQVSSYNHM
jgi:hypothetical protein